MNVVWDEPDRRPCIVVSSFLRLVESPQARGGAYWRNEYNTLAATVRTELGAFEASLSSSFRPCDGIGAEIVAAKLDNLHISTQALIDFLKADDDGQHL